MMRRLLPLHLLLLLQMCSPQFREACAGNYIGEWQYYSHLFSKLEEALLKNKTVMSLLRQIFMCTENVEIHFSVQLEVVNGTNLSSICDNDPLLVNETLSSFDTFYLSNSSDYEWKLCNDSLEMTYTTQSLSKIESEIEKHQIDAMIGWLSLLHGNILSIFLLISPDYWIHFLDSSYHFYDCHNFSTSLTLKTEGLDCNPSIVITQCSLSKLLSWVSI